ncbi:hypothetical protein [Streptosporangium longisporum]|uniref:WD40 repeat domain-containing protein n=1 Tax=Streptosporangium longisporum TaxID=46187 RepID=A0ABP6LG83_9ACTN
MNMLREDLHALAEQAPAVDLAARAVRGARRRRATRLAVAAAAVTCLIAGGGAALVQQVRPEPPVVLTPPPARTVPLPARGIGPAVQAYRPVCRVGFESCGGRVWLLVTDGGDTTYELPEVSSQGPLAITADGRRIAYYSARQRRIVVRDLASGRVWRAPLKQPAEDFAVEFSLRLSPGGLRFIVSGWGGRREPNKLVDVERGTVTDLERGWWPVSVADGSGPVVLARPYDMTSRVWVLGHEPITIGYFAYDYSALAPDGRTLARVERSVDPERPATLRQGGSIVVVDAIRGGRERRTRISGMAEGLHAGHLGAWLNATEVTMLATAESNRPSVLYAVDVRTGRSRELRTLRGAGATVVAGLVR